MTPQSANCVRQWKDYQYRSICMVIFFALIASALAPGYGWAGDAGIPTSWQLGLRSSGYFYQTQDFGGNGSNEFQSYQTISGTASGLLKGHLVFRGSGRFANDLAVNTAAFESSRWYSGYAEARISPQVKARVGRQFLQSGVTGLTLDGAWLSYRPSAFLEANIWAGAQAPLAGDFQLGDMNENAAAGARVALRFNRKWRVVFSGANREKYGQTSERPVGLEVITSALKHTRIFSRVAYDLEAERLAKIQIQGQWRPAHNLPVVDVQFLDRHPSIDAASWFSRFTGLERIRVLRASAQHLLPSRFGGELEYLNTNVGSRSSSRIGLAAILPMGRLGYSLRLGDAGEESRFYGEVRIKAFPWLELDAQASILSYALLEDAPANEEHDLKTLAAGFRAQLRPGFRVVGQVQSLDNPFYSQDVRFLLGIDLSMARGTSNFGLGQGGWLQ